MNPPIFFFVVIYDVDNQRLLLPFCSNNKQNTNATDLYPRVVLLARFHVKMFDEGTSLSAMLKITK